MSNRRVPESPTGSTQSLFDDNAPRDAEASRESSGNRIIPRALLMLALATSALGLLSFPIGEYDDSILMVGARLVARGKLPYIDFYTHYGPLGYTILSRLL